MLVSYLLLILLLPTQFRYHTHLLVPTLVAAALHQMMIGSSYVGSTLLYHGYYLHDGLTSSVLIGMYAILVALVIYYRSDSLQVSLLLVTSLGVSSLLTSNQLLTVLIAVELQSLGLYLYFTHSMGDSSRVSNSRLGLIYLYNAALASAVLIYGMSVGSSILMAIAIIWKLGGAPLHAWSVPLIDGLTRSTAIVYSSVTKYGLISVLALLPLHLASMDLLIVIGWANLLIGSIGLLVQTRLLRLFVYSGLIQIGYILLVASTHVSMSLAYYLVYSLVSMVILLIWPTPSTDLNYMTSLPRSWL